MSEQVTETANAVTETANAVTESANAVTETVKTVAGTVETSANTIATAADKIIAETGTVADLVEGAGNTALLTNLEGKINQLVNSVASGVSEHGEAGWDLLMLPLRISAAQDLLTGLIALIVGIVFVRFGYKTCRKYLNDYNYYHATCLSDVSDDEVKLERYTSGKTINNSPIALFPAAVFVVGCFTLLGALALTDVMSWVQMAVPEVKFADLLMKKFLG